ncbi:tetratricopeptide repeat protein [bacterium]|nr:tetratricopeptide repeat protein [bacterium]
MKFIRSQFGIVLLVLLALTCCKEREKQKINQLNADSLRYYQKGDLEKAIPKALEALKLSEKIFGLDDPEYAVPLTNLGLLYLEQGNQALADQYLMQAYTIRKNKLGDEDPKTLVSLLNLSEMYRKTGRYMDAESEARVVIVLREKLLKPNDTELARSYYALANTYFLQGKYPSAKPLYEKALGIMENNPTRLDNELSSSIMSELGVIYKREGKFKDAIPLYEKAIGFDILTYGREHPNVGMGLVALADNYYYSGNVAMAEQHYNQGLEILQKAFDPYDARLIPLYEKVALFCEKTGKPQKAAEFRDRVKRIKQVSQH